MVQEKLEMLFNLSPEIVACELVDFESPCHLGFCECNDGRDLVGDNVQAFRPLVNNKWVHDLAGC